MESVRKNFFSCCLVLCSKEDNMRCRSRRRLRLSYLLHDSVNKIWISRLGCRVTYNFDNTPISVQPIKDLSRGCTVAIITKDVTGEAAAYGFGHAGYLSRMKEVEKARQSVDQLIYIVKRIRYSETLRVAELSIRIFKNMKAVHSRTKRVQV